MKISFSWLQDHIDISESIEVLTHRLTMSGLEVEGIEDFEEIEGSLEGLVIGEVVSCAKHPNADKLKVTKVDLGNGSPKDIVCGAPNVAEGQKVVVATVGTTLHPLGHDSFKIKKSKIRGELSEGMICAEDEIGLGESHDGIMVLETDLANGTPASEYFHPAVDKVIEIGLTPNRADATSHYGVAREISVLTGAELKNREEELNSQTADLPFEISIENEEACPRYCGVTIADIKVGPSPAWLQAKLKAIGLAPINNVVDITNYVLHDLGQPLHAFDYDKITSKKVAIKTLKEGTKFTTLDDVERKLFGNDLMVCNDDQPMCIAGVFGGKESGITESSRNVFLESAYFSPDFIRKSSLQHSLKTDASFRFERGIDPEITKEALIKAANLICEIAGGKIAGEVTDLRPKKIEPFKFDVNTTRIQKLIGKEISKEEICSILEALEIKVSDQGEVLGLEVPAYRVDVQREADIVEEVLRIHGFDNIELSENLAAGYLAPAEDSAQEEIYKNVSEVALGNGFHEIMNNSLTSASFAEQSDSIEEKETVHVLNKLSDDHAVLRQSLLYSGLETIAHNVNRKQFNLKLYEFGKIYGISDKYEEKQKLGFWVTGNEKDESWQVPSKETSFTSLVSIVSQVLQRNGIVNYSFEAFNSSDFKNGQKILVNGAEIGFAGSVSNKVLGMFKLEQSVFYAELDIKKLSRKSKKELEYEPVSKFPEVRRDLSVVVEDKVTYQQICDLAYSVERKLLKRVNAFDLYKGDKIEKNTKAISISFILQDKEKTLNEKQIDNVMNKMVAAFEKELNALIRK